MRAFSSWKRKDARRQRLQAARPYSSRNPPMVPVRICFPEVKRVSQPQTRGDSSSRRPSPAGRVPAISSIRGFMNSVMPNNCPGSARISSRTRAKRDPRVFRSATRIVSSKVIHRARLRATASSRASDPESACESCFGAAMDSTRSKYSVA